MGHLKVAPTSDAGPYSLRAKTNRESPDTVATYCLLPTRYVIGPLLMAPPRLVFHSRAPVRASSAWKYPSRPPAKSRFDAVVRMPLSVTSVMLNFHF